MKYSNYHMGTSKSRLILVNNYYIAIHAKLC